MASAGNCKGSLNGGSSLGRGEETASGIDKISRRPAPLAIIKRPVRARVDSRYKPANTSTIGASGGNNQAADSAVFISPGRSGNRPGPRKKELFSKILQAPVPV